MSDTWLDFAREKAIKEKEEREEIRRDFCYEECDEHNENCPYYDAEEEYYDYNACFEDRG
jgi:hypothetical protein